MMYTERGGWTWANRMFHPDFDDLDVFETEAKPKGFGLNVWALVKLS